MCSARLRPKRLHYRTPFLAVRPDAASKFLVSHQVRILMRHRLLDKVVFVFFQKLTVQPNLVFPVIGLTGSHAPEVKGDVRINFHAIKFPCFSTQLSHFLSGKVFNGAGCILHAKIKQITHVIGKSKFATNLF